MPSSSSLAPTIIILASTLAFASPLHHQPHTATSTSGINNINTAIGSPLYRRSQSSSSSTQQLQQQQQRQGRYYATWDPQQLCSPKITFDPWEESFDTLIECCEMIFSWDYEECIHGGSSGSNDVDDSISGDFA